jgi:hypothetical protein
LRSTPSFVLQETTSSDVPADTDVSYSYKFIIKWSESTHPVDFPFDAHWSPMILALHSAEYSMWKQGVSATPGVQLVAETGATGTLQQELEGALPTIGSVAIGVSQFNSIAQMQDISLS